METKQRPAWRRWLKRIAWGLLGVLLLLALFHRIIIFQTARYFVARAAREQKLDLQYDLGGTIFTSLSVTNLHGRPTGPGQFEKIDLGVLEVRYSLTGLIQKGLAGLLEEVDLRDVTVVMHPSPSPPPKPEEKPGKLSIPPLLPKRLNIENVNFISHGPDGDLEIADFVFQLDPDKPGALKLKTLNVPGVRRWDDVSAQATFHDRNLVLTDLSAGPEIQLKRLNLDGSKLDQNEVALGLNGTLLGSTTSLEAKATHLDAAKHLNLHANVASLNFDEIWRYLNLHQTLHGAVEKLDLSFDGAPDKPVEWTGNMAANLRGIAFDQQRIGDVLATVDFHDGHAQVTVADQVDARNKLNLDVGAALPPKLDGFAKTAASGKIDVEAPDFASLLKPFGVAADGDAELHVPFEWNQGRLVTDVTLNSSHLTMNDVESKNAAFQIHAEKTIVSGEKSPLEKLSSHLQGNLGSLRFKDYAANEVKLTLANQENKVTVDNLSLSMGSNSLKLQGHAVVPADFQGWQNMPAQASLDLNAPDLQSFVALGSDVKLKGALQIKGNASADRGKSSGEFQIAARDVQSNDLTLRSIDGNIKIADSQAQIMKLEAVFDDQNWLNISGTASLTAPMAYNLSLDVALANLSAFQPLLKKSGNDQSLAGSLNLRWHGTGEVQPAKHSGAGTLTLANGRFGDKENLAASITANYTPDVVDVSELKASGMQVDASLAAHWEKQRLQIHDLAAAYKKIPVLKGSIEMPLDAAQFKDPARLIPDDQAIKISLQTGEVDLKPLLQQPGQKETPVTGKAEVNVAVSGSLKNLAADVSVNGRQLQASAASQVSPADVQFDLHVKDEHLTMNGSVHQPLLQALQLNGDVPLDVSQFRNPALMVPPDQPIKFSLHTGEVDLKKLQEQLGKKEPAVTGSAEVRIDVTGPLKNLVADISLKGNQLRASAAAKAAPADVNLDLHVKDQHLKIDGSVNQPLVQAMKLSGDLPVDLTQFKDPQQIVPADQPLKLAFQSGEVDLKKLFQQLGQKDPAASGTVQLNFNADGALKDLVASLSLRGNKLQSTKATNVAPAELALDLNLKDRRLKLGGSVHQKLIQPLEITGDLPLDVEAIRKTKTLDPQTPLSLQVKLPQSSLGFIPSLTPAVRFVKGTAAIDVRVKGTVAAPVFDGAVKGNLEGVRFADPSAPPLNDASIRLDFTENQINLHEFKSGLAGGTIGASGTIKFAKITEPVFDLKFVSDKALVKQDDNITVRVSSDLKIVGPLNAGTVSGTVNATKSRFFKDIDILPIGLPGRPAPQPPAEPTVISFPNPPLRDWKFDVAIKTADDFLIQGNLADGKATSDLHLGGTGKAPWLEGSVRIKTLTASLPFSKLEINSGNIFFTQDAPFVPKLNIVGTSTIRDYNVRVTIIGTASAPQAIFSSEPPLGQSDIVSLLATGTTAKDLAGDSSALAGRAAFLVVQKYYRKWFKKDQPPPDKTDDSFFSRTQFDVGSIDPKTGKQAVEVKQPLSDHFSLIGGIDVGGDFRGQLKYLIKFR